MRIHADPDPDTDPKPWFHGWHSSLFESIIYQQQECVVCLTCGGIQCQSVASSQALGRGSLPPSRRVKILKIKKYLEKRQKEKKGFYFA
jgi:hypothetical protein